MYLHIHHNEELCEDLCGDLCEQPLRIPFTNTFTNTPVESIAAPPPLTDACACLLHHLKGVFGEVIVKMFGMVVVKMIENDICFVFSYIYI